MDQKLLDYIKENRQKSFSDEQIKKALLDVGWKEEDVDNGLRSIDKNPYLKKKRILIIGIIFVVIVILAIVVFVSRTNSTNLSIESKNKESGVVYGKLSLSIPSKAIANKTEFKIVSLSLISDYEDKISIGGVYYIEPKDLLLAEPADISITYTQESVVEALKIDKYFTEDNLTLAYYDGQTDKFIPIETEFNKNTKTLTGKINKLYGEGITVIGEINKTIDKLDINDFCKDAVSSKDACITLVAVYNGDANLCSAISNQSQKTQCVEKANELNQAIRICELNASGTTNSDAYLIFLDSCEKEKCTNGKRVSNMYGDCNDEWKVYCTTCSACWCE